MKMQSYMNKHPFYVVSGWNGLAFLFYFFIYLMNLQSSKEIASNFRSSKMRDIFHVGSWKLPVITSASLGHLICPSPRKCTFWVSTNSRNACLFALHRWFSPKKKNLFVLNCSIDIYVQISCRRLFPKSHL